MENQKSDLSVPKEWQEKFLIKRIGEEPIEISIMARDEILKALNDGARFIQIGKYTLMLNSIKSIDPLWGEENIPPRPQIRSSFKGLSESGSMIQERNTEDIDRVELWDKLFKGKSLKLYV